MQIVLVYLKSFRRNLLLKCVSLSESTKNSRKSIFLGGRGLKSLNVVNVDKIKKPVLVMICTYICNRFYTRRANSSKITFF